MGTTSRRRFLKGLGATVSAIAATTALSSTSQVGQDAQQQTPAALNMAPAAASKQGGRKMITVEALEILVAEQLSAWVATRQTFTAYDITQALRAARPGVNIFHQPVRDIVHRRMWPAVHARIYAQEQVWFPTGSAYQYQPLV
jgi:hypothetical protein